MIAILTWQMKAPVGSTLNIFQVPALLSDSLLII